MPKISERLPKYRKQAKKVAALDLTDEEFVSMCKDFPIKITRALKMVFYDCETYAAASSRYGLSKQHLNYYLDKMEVFKNGQPNSKDS